MPNSPGSHTGTLRECLKSAFGVDLRSLAFLRILLGALTLLDLAHRATDIRAFYTDDGVMPRSQLFDDEVAKDFPWWSITFHSMSGRWEVEAALLVLAGAFTLSMMLGYRTRLSTFLAWLFNVSIQARNPVVLQAGDMLHRLLLFWGMFLPWAEVASLDAAFRKRSGKAPTERSNVVVSIGTAAYLLQITFMYFFTALLKSAPEWRAENAGVYYALHVEQFTTRLGHWLSKQRGLMKPLNVLVLWAESAGSLLIFSPFATQWMRLFAIALLTGLQVGFGACMELGTFPLVSITAYAGALPSLVWDFIPARVKDRTNAAGEKIIDSFAWLAALWPSPPELAPRLATIRSRIGAVLCGVFITHVFLWNLGTITTHEIPLLNRTRWISNIPRLDQIWNMFAPYPIKDDGWFIIPGVLKNGETVDLFADGKPVSWERPPLVSATFRSFRWRKYMMNIWQRSYRMHRPPYASYLCREWNRTHPPEQQLLKLEIIFMLKMTLPNYEPSTIKKESLWQHDC